MLSHTHWGGGHLRCDPTPTCSSPKESLPLSREGSPRTDSLQERWPYSSGPKTGVHPCLGPQTPQRGRIPHMWGINLSAEMPLPPPSITPPIQVHAGSSGLSQTGVAAHRCSRWSMQQEWRGDLRRHLVRILRAVRTRCSSARRPPQQGPIQHPVSPVHRCPGPGGRGHAAQLHGAGSDHLGDPGRHHPMCQADLCGHAGGTVCLQVRAPRPPAPLYTRPCFLSAGGSRVP